MSLDVALTHDFGGFSIDARFVASGRTTALFGPSGAGKTTIVNAIAGLFRPQVGRVALDGVVLADSARGLFLPPHRRRIGYVFQDGRLFPHLTVRQNLNYGRLFAPRGERSVDFDRIVALLGIEPILARRPSLLSGGEKSRVAIGRALLSSPKLLLLDEPLAALDAARKAEILPYLERLQGLGLPIVHVSHTVEDVRRLADTVVMIEAGRVVAVGAPAETLPGV